jgi:RNA polymerase sigma-70 factor, ECF subfamily
VSESRTETKHEPADGVGPTGGAGPTDGVGLDTRRLLAAHLNGDAQAFPVIMERYQAQVYSYLVRCGIDGASRDDLFQEIFLKVHLAAHSYEPERAFEPWLFTIVANTARSFFRKERVRELIGPYEWENKNVNTTTGEHLAQAKETTLWLESRLKTLPLAQREVVVMCCFKSLSQQDVASILNIPLSTVKTHLHRGRAALAKALARRHAQCKKEVAE